MNNLMIDKIHTFWFGTIINQTTREPRNKLWFGGDSSTDTYILNTFESMVLKAQAGDLDSWRQSPKGTLTLILLLDQFPLNMYRKSAKAYAFEDKAIQTCNHGLDNKHDLKLTFIERTFFYLPFEHSENVDDQARSVALFSNLMEQAPAPLKPHAQICLNYAISHKKIVDQFYRFPHRNDALNRQTTKEESRFLSTGNNRFGQ